MTRPKRIGIVLVVGSLLSSYGCIIAPVRVAAPLRVTVIDARDQTPIANAMILYLVCDVHDFHCEHGKLVTTTSSDKGQVKIDGERKWGFWVLLPGGVPVPNHLIAIWAPGYSAFVFGQYDDSVESKKSIVRRSDIFQALNSIPKDISSSNALLNSPKELSGGTIRLLRSGL